LKAHLVGWLSAATLLLSAPASSAAVLKVGVLNDSPPCAEAIRPGDWQGTAVELWQRIAARQKLAYVLEGFQTPQALLEASRRGVVDVGVGCLTVSPDRLGRYSFSLPFQEGGLAVLIRSDRIRASFDLLKILLNPQLLQVLAGYLLTVALISLLLWRDAGHHASEGARKERLRSYTHVFQIVATGTGTNTISQHTRGHVLIVGSWVIRLIGASLILGTITRDAINQSSAGRYNLRSVNDLRGLRVAARPGSISADVLAHPPLKGKVRVVSLSSLEQGPGLLLNDQADALLADEAQIRHLLAQLPKAQRAQFVLSLPGTNLQSKALALSPTLSPEVAGAIDRAISEAKRDGLVPELP
jgi:polar amino acid transport system substrate-binding protein